MPDAFDFDSLARSTRPVLVRFLTRMVGEADAEDVVQAALSKAAAASSSFRGDANARTWLFRIAANAAKDWLRANRRLDSLDETVEGDDPEDVPESASQERKLVREQMSQCVHEFLGRLPESYQTVLALSDCEELSDREIASILGVTEGAAKIRLHRARTRLKKELEAGCSFYRDEENVLCCDRKEQDREPAYRFEESARPMVRSREERGESEPKEEHSMTAVEILPSRQKSLIGVGASIAAGCQPCTQSFVNAAREAGACDRGVRLAIESGLEGRANATAGMNAFAAEKFAAPELDDAFRAERLQLEALIGIAAAIAGNAASLMKTRVEAARALGASDAQIRVAAEIARTAKRNAESEADAALEESLTGKAERKPCCSGGSTEKVSNCSCKG